MEGRPPSKPQSFHPVWQIGRPLVGQGGRTILRVTSDARCLNLTTIDLLWRKKYQCCRRRLFPRTIPTPWVKRLRWSCGPPTPDSRRVDWPDWRAVPSVALWLLGKAVPCPNFCLYSLSCCCVSWILVGNYLPTCQHFSICSVISSLYLDYIYPIPILYLAHI